MKLSFIVPMYNAQKFIEECVSSILKCSGDYEVVLVDDGSKDNTYEVCKKFSSLNNVKLLHKDNGGVSSARNFGLKNSSGEYVTFIDSDDYITLGFLDFLCGADLYCRNISSAPFRKCSDIQKQFIKYDTYMNSVCNKFFKREIIEQNKLCFDESLYRSEDLLFVIQYLMHAKSINYVEGDYYFYRVNESSQTHSSTITNIENNIRANEKIIGTLVSNGKYPLLQRYIHCVSYIPFLTDPAVYDVKRFRTSTTFKDLYTYRGRIDLFLITLSAKLGLSFINDLYITLKKGR